MSNLTKYDIVKNKVYLDLMKSIKTYNPDVVEPASFIPQGQTEPIHFWKFVNKDIQSIKKPISRSGYAGIRDPFIVRPEMTVAIDESKAYGIAVDDNIEQFIEGKITKEQLLPEVEMTIDNLINNGLVWVGRSVKICHPDGAAYGEIDELLYSPEEDMYYIADTKTSSAVDKIGYYYQLASYVQIMRALNPDKKFSDTVLINWVRIKDEKWEMDRNWKAKYEAVHGKVPPVGTKIDSTHPIYNALFTKKIPAPGHSRKQELRRIDLTNDFGVTKNIIYKLVVNDWHLLHSLFPQNGLFGSVDSLKDINMFPELKKYNDTLQQVYNTVKDNIEGVKY